LTWRIEFLPSARAELLALDRPVQARILRSLHRLAAAPRSAANVKALKGNARYRLRVGDWRIIYTLLDGLKDAFFRHDRQVSGLQVRKSRLSAGLLLTGRDYIYWDARF
jgi:mRNA interferase RelE/StbE